MKNLIYTAIYHPYYFDHEKNEVIKYDDNMDSLLKDYIVSLREVGKYTGDVAILFYGGCIDFETRQLIKKYNIRFLYIDEDLGNDFSSISWKRFINLSQYINLNEYDNIVYTDYNVWFNDNINSLWNLIPENGVIMGGNILKKDPILLHENDYIDHVSFEKRMDSIEKKYNQYGVSSGFMAGSKKSFINKCSLLRESYSIGLVPKIWGSDQFLLNYHFDIENDLHDITWNFIPQQDSKQGLTFDGKKAIVIYRAEFLTKEEKYSFKFNHPDFKKVLGEK